MIKEIFRVSSAGKLTDVNQSSSSVSPCLMPNIRAREDTNSSSSSSSSGVNIKRRKSSNRY